MYAKKKLVEELPQEPTQVWNCTNNICHGWMRDNFTFDRMPVCVLCSSPMEGGTRMLPRLMNACRKEPAPVG